MDMTTILILKLKIQKLKFDVDYDPNDDINLTYQSGYSVSKTNQVSASWSLSCR